MLSRVPMSDEGPRSRRHLSAQRIWSAATLVLALALAGFVISQTRLAELADLWRMAQATWLVGYLLALYADVWTIGRRYWWLAGRTISFHRFLELVVLQVAVGNMVVAPAGAAALVAGLRGRHGIPVRDTFAALVLAKTSDLLAAVLLLAMGSIAVWPEIRPLHATVGVILGLGSCAVLLVAAVFVFRSRCVRAVAVTLERVRLGKGAVFSRMLGALEALALQDAAWWRGVVARTLGYSLLALAFTSFSFYCSARLMSVPITIWHSLFAASLLQLILVVPIHVLGGLGVGDITVLYILRVFRPEHTALAAVVVGMKAVFYAANLAMLGYVPLSRLWSRVRAAPPMSQSRDPQGKR
jgi:hypothetical protein